MQFNLYAVDFLKIYLSLSKFRIAILVLITTFIGYILARESSFSYSVLFLVMAGVYLVSSGSFILNQAYESQIDSKMERTKNRPIPKGKISVQQARIMGFIFIVIGLFICSFVNALIVCLSLITCILYNFFYTLRWKKDFL